MPCWGIDQVGRCNLLNEASSAPSEWGAGNTPKSFFVWGFINTHLLVQNGRVKLCDCPKTVLSVKVKRDSVLHSEILQHSDPI